MIKIMVNLIEIDLYSNLVFLYIDELILTSDRNEISFDIMTKAIIVWEDLLDEARAKFGYTTIPIHYAFSDYLLEHIKIRLLKSGIPENLIDAFIDYFDKSELIENGCLALSDLSLAGRLDLLNNRNLFTSSFLFF